MDVGAALVGVPVADPVDPVEDVLDDPPLAGEGETIDGVVALEDVVDVAADALAPEEALELEDAVELEDDPGLVLSFGTPLAKGSRAIRARTTLTGWLEAVVSLVVV